MATLQLTDGTTTHDLNGSTYAFHGGTLDFGNPREIQAAGMNLFSDGWFLKALGFTKRTITVSLRVNSADLATFGDDVSAINTALRKAREYATSGRGNKWQLKWNPGGSAADVYFTIQHGRFQIPRGSMQSWFIKTAPTVPRCFLELECDPIGEGDSETIENYCPDPSFEVAGTALADWTEDIDGTITGTTARDTTQQKYGNASLKIVVTDSTTAGRAIKRKTAAWTAAAGEVWSFSVWIHATDLTLAKAEVRIRWDPGGQAATAARTSVTTDWVRIDLENQTAPGGTTGVQVECQVEVTDANATATAYFDGVMAIKAASIPTTWVSGRDVKNHFDDDGQAHLNYVDIHSVPGDYPALLQLKAAENEAHTAMWLGARHGGTSGRQYDAGLFHEGEDFGTWGVEPSGAGSGNAYGQSTQGVGFDAVTSGNAASATSITVNHTAAVRSDRIIVAVVETEDDHATDGVPSGVTWNGNAMTMVPSSDKIQSKAGPTYLATSIWYIVASSTGAQDCVATFNSTMNAMVMGVYSFYGVDQSSPVGTAVASGGTSASPGVIVAGAADDIAIAGVAANSVGIGPITGTPGTGETEDWDEEDTNGRLAGMGYREQATGASTTISPTLSASVDFARSGVAIKKATQATAASPEVLTKSVATPPQGSYRVLARLRNPDGANWKVAMGWAYGGVTQDPTVASQYSDIPVGTTAFHILDLGALVVPPEPLPDNATLGTLTLRLAMYRAAASATGASDRLHVDWVLLLPVDFGSGYVTKTSAADVVVADSKSRPRGMSLWDTSDVFQSRPENRGSPPQVDPDGTRVYMVSDDGAADIDDGWSVSAVVTPRYLHVG